MVEDSFGSLLRAARLGARKPKTIRPLTQRELADAIGEKLGAYNSPTSQAVSYWERGKYQPASKDRDVLFALVKVLVQYGGLADLRAANRLLEIGGYAALDSREQQAIFGTASSQKEHSASDSATPEPAPTAPASGRASMLHQLRAPSQDFVGRADEIGQIVGALRGAASGGAVAGISGVRGMGGIGKTELAYVVAERVRHLFADAQLVIDLLGSRGDAALTPIQALQSVIRAFNREARLPDEERELVALYRSTLADRRVLILADGARDAAQVRPLIPPPGSALLITSRQRFQLPGMRAIDLERLSSGEALDLLRKTCARLTPEQAGQIAALCGNLPLALIISGGILDNDDQLDIGRYIQQLSDERRRLAQLRDPDDPNLDVEASLNLSYAALDATARQALAQLAVFAGSFDRAAGAATLSLPEGAGLDDTLGLLRRRSLLEYDRDQDRYSLHELVRVFALARLEAEEERAARLRHARHYIQVAAEAERLYLSGHTGVAAGLALFDAERTQLDAARGWLQQHAGVPDVDELLMTDANETAYIGDLRYPKRSGRIPQLEMALAAARRKHNRAAQGVFLGNLGSAYAALGEVLQAIDFFLQYLAVAREIGDRRGESSALGNLGAAYMMLDQPRRAIDFYRQNLDIVREIGDRRGECNTLGNLGVAYKNLGVARRAIEFYQQSLAVAREIGDRRGESRALGNLGNAHAELGELSLAITFFQQDLVITHELGDHQGEAETSWNYGLALVRLNEPAQAIPLLELSLDFYQAIGHPRAASMAVTLDHIRQHGTLPPPAHPSDPLEDLPDAVRQAIEQLDAQALLMALEVLPAEEAAAIVERLERAGIIGWQPEPDLAAPQQQDAGQPPRSPEELFATLPEPVRRALERGDEAAYQAALDALPAGERRKVELTVTEIMRAAQPDPRQRFDALLRDIARVAAGDAAPRQRAEAGLGRLEEGGWMLREPVRRIWDGERDAAALVAGLDEQDRALVERVLELITLIGGNPIGKQ